MAKFIFMIVRMRQKDGKGLFRDNAFALTGRFPRADFTQGVALG